MRWLHGSGQEKSFWLPFAALKGRRGELEFKVIAPNVDTEATLVALCFYFISVQKQGEMSAKGVLEKES